MEVFVLLLFALCGFRMIRYGRGLRINGPADKNITAGMTVPLECHSDQYGIVFEFTNRSSNQSVRTAECDFNKDLGSAVLMHDSLKSAYNITRISRTCILTILSLTEDQCGTYSCTELYFKSEYVYFNMSCIGTPGVTNVQSEPNTGTLIGLILGAVVIIAIGVCLVCRKLMNTTNIPETGALTHENESLMPQALKTIEPQANVEQVHPSVAAATDFHIHAGLEERMDNESDNSSTEALGDDSMERVNEANDYSKPLNNGTNLTIPETYMTSSICLDNLSAGPNVSPVTNYSFTCIDDVPEPCMNEESADSAIEEQIIYERSNSYLHNKNIVDKIKESQMGQRLKEELIDAAKSGAFMKGMDTFERKKLGEKLLDGQKLKISTFVLDTIENEDCED